MTAPVIFDITGTQTTELRLPLPPATVAKLAGMEIEAPEHVTLLLREATMDERAAFEALQGSPKLKGDPLGTYADLLMERAAPGTDRRVVLALLGAAGPSGIATLTAAYLEGKLPDPKVVQQALSTLTGTLESLLKAIATAKEPSPSSATSTA